MDIFGTDPDDDLAPDGVGGRTGDGGLEEAGVGDGAAVLAGPRGKEIHRGRTDESGDEHVHRTLVQCLRCVELLELAVAHHCDAVAHGHRLDLIVRDVDRRAPEALMQLLQHGAGLDDRAADGDALPLATRELFRLSLQELPDREHVGHLGHATVDLLLRHAAELQPECDVVVHAHMRVEGVVLEDHRDVAVLRRHVVDQPLADEDVAGGLLLEAREHAEGGGLAATGGPHEDEELLVADLE